MHEFCVRLGSFEPRFGDTPVAEVGAGFHFCFWITVVLGGNPRFAVENVGVFESFGVGVGVSERFCAELVGFFGEFGGKMVGFGAMDGDVHASEGGH